ncbi:MAG: cysteine dioxygenase family protein [Cyanobacteria bacterium P01_H01_bin.74]
MVNLDTLTQFKDSQYARHLIFKSSHVEILLVCWRPGQKSPVHGHGNADGLMIILQGEMTNTTFTKNGQKITTVWQSGAIGHTPVGDRHEVINNANTDAVSLHIYAPPLKRDLQGADMGYNNAVELKEVNLPEQVFQYFLGLSAKQSSKDAIDPVL